MNDIFLEYLVKKKSKEDVLKQVLLILACIFVLFVCTVLLFSVLAKFIWILPPLYGIVIYATVQLRRRFSIEYEYIFTNGQLDVDVIYGKTKRKSLVSLLCKNIEYMAPYNGENLSDREVIDTIYDPVRRGKYYIDFTQGGQKLRLLIQPPEKILQNMKRYNPRNINL